MVEKDKAAQSPECEKPEEGYTVALATLTQLKEVVKELNMATRSFYCTGKEAAEIVGLSYTAWREMTNCGLTPPPRKFGHKVRWRRDELFAWCEANCPPRDRWERIKSKKFKG